MLPRDHDSDRLDRAIDDVARRMTAGAPSTDLRTRVLARLEEHDAPWWPGRLAWLAAPLAAAAIIVLVVFLRTHQDANGGTKNVTHAPPIAQISDRPLPPTPPQDVVQATASPAASAERTTVARTSVSTAPRALRRPSDIEAMAPAT